MTAANAGVDSVRPARAWYRDVTHDQWMAFVGAYLGWVLDGFDFTILTFLLVDIQRSFAVNATLAGLLGGHADVPPGGRHRRRHGGRSLGP